MPANSSLSLTSLDFDTLKANLILFMQNQTVFKDYNFLGSNLNVLMDILAYNSTLNAFYLNMVGSEAFLDTAQLRDSVVSRAKELNYIPRSARSAMGAVSVSFTTSGIAGTLLIPAGTLFSGTNSNGGFSFVTDQNHTLLSAGSNYFIPALTVFEGKLFTETFIVDNTIENQKFILLNKNIDTTSIHVTVTSNSGQSVVNYRMVTSLFGLHKSSLVFFVQEDRGSSYEIYFGDGIFGQVPTHGSAVAVTYRVTKGAQGNGVTRFNMAQDLGPTNAGVIVSANVVTTTPSQDGADIEAIESIRFRAPKHFQAQGRAITAADYKDLILEQFPEVKDVSVFGGEDISGSVQYGTIFIALTTNSGAPVSGVLQNQILFFLNGKKSLAVKLTIKDPEYVYLVPTITVYADLSQTTFSIADVRTEVLKSIIAYNSKNLQLFNCKFMGSKFSEAIDSADVSIKGSDIKLVMYKNVLFSNGFPQTVTVNFNNPIIPGTITSTNFILTDSIEYKITDFNPNFNTFKGAIVEGSFKTINTSNSIFFKSVSNNQNYINAGTVDYNKGILYVRSIDVYSFMNPNGIRIEAVPVNNDVYGILETVVEIDETNVLIDMVSL